VLGCYFVVFCGSVFLTRGFLFILGACTDRPVADPRVCGDLSQPVPLPLQLQRHLATFFACFLTFAHRFFAALTLCHRRQDGQIERISKV
jgi:hypothetical protein